MLYRTNFLGGLAAGFLVAGTGSPEAVFVAFAGMGILAIGAQNNLKESGGEDDVTAVSCEMDGLIGRG